MHENSLPAGDRQNAADRPSPLSLPRRRRPPGFTMTEAARRCLAARGKKTVEEVLVEYEAELLAVTRMDGAPCE